jgi:hypothetical protein
MRTSRTNTAVLLFGLFLSVTGLLGAGIVTQWAAAEWHGLSYHNTWPAILLLAWSGLSGIALCMRLKPATKFLAVWCLAFCAWIQTVTWSQDDGSWEVATGLCIALLVVVVFVIRATSASKPRPQGSGQE